MSERSPNSRLRIVVLGYIVRCPLGGLAWHHLQYALGLSRPGHEVLFLEDSGDDVWACYDPTTNVTGPDPTYGLGFTSRTFERVGLSESWAYHDALAGSWHGPAADRALEMCRTADLLINLSGSNVLRPWTASVPARVFLDTDSAFTQLRNVVDAARRDRALAHTAFFTFGENIGSPSCRVPDDGIRWLPTRQPIVLDAWPVSPGPGKGEAHDRAAVG